MSDFKTPGKITLRENDSTIPYTFTLSNYLPSGVTATGVSDFQVLTEDGTDVTTYFVEGIVSFDEPSQNFTINLSYPISIPSELLFERYYILAVYELSNGGFKQADFARIYLRS